MGLINQLRLRVDYGEIAKGMLELFDEEEIAVLALGMLPALKMQILLKQFRERMLRDYHPLTDYDRTLIEGLGGICDPDMYLARVRSEDGGFTMVEFSMRALIGEFSKDVAVAILRASPVVFV